MPAPDTTDPTVVRSILSEVDGSLASLDLRLVLHGDEFDTWAVGEEIFVKFPRSKAFAAKVGIEAAFTPLVQACLGTLVPDIVLASDPIRSFPWPFLGHRRARGIQAQAADGTTVTPSFGARRALAADIARVLGAVHAIPPDEASSAALEMSGPFFQDPLLLSDGARRRAVEIAGHAAASFLDDPTPPPSWSGESVPTHRDIKGEHLFLEPGLDRLSAVIDWADVEFAEPAKDLAGLVIWMGPNFAREVVATGPWDAVVAERAIRIAREGLLRYLDAVLLGREREPDPRLLAAELRAAFSG